MGLPVSNFYLGYVFTTMQDRNIIFDQVKVEYLGLIGSRFLVGNNLKWHMYTLREDFALLSINFLRKK